MKTSKIIAAAALSLLAAVGAQAETYEGVHAPVSANSRVEVKSQAVVAAHSENPYAEGVSSRVAPALAASTDRAGVRAEAVAASHSANPYAEGYGQGVAVAGQHGRPRHRPCRSPRRGTRHRPARAVIDRTRDHQPGQAPGFFMQRWPQTTGSC